MSDDNPKYGVAESEAPTTDAEADRAPLTTNSGESQPDNQNSRSAGLEGAL